MPLKSARPFSSWLAMASKYNKQFADADLLSRKWEEVLAGKITIEQYDKVRKEIQNGKGKKARRD